MKALIFMVLTFFVIEVTFAQVAINNDNSNPDPSAMLEVKSTDKGLLIPRLTTSKRILLDSLAVGGLMVFDTDLSRFYIHNGYGWEPLSTDLFWAGTETETYMTNLNGNLGIGTYSPTAKLHVSGGNLLLDRRNLTTGLARSVTIGGAQDGPGSDYARIDFQNYDLYDGAFDYPGARISSRNTTGNNGGDLRFFTGGSSLSEKMLITEDGYVGIGTSNPTSNLVVGDDLSLYPSLTGDTYLTIADQDNTDYSALILGGTPGNYGKISFQDYTDEIRIDMFKNSVPTIGVLLLNDNGCVGIQNPTLEASELLTVGNDFGSALGGNRITIGNDAGYSGINIGEDIDNRAFILWDYSNNALQMGTRSAATTYSQTLVVKNGRVGVKNGSPIFDFQVGDGNITALNGSNTRMVVSDNDNAERAAVLGLAKTSGGSRVEAQLEANGSSNSGPSVIVGAASSHPLYLRTANLTRMTVATNGNVGIGTLSPGWLLEVNGSAAKPGGGSWASMIISPHIDPPISV